MYVSIPRHYAHLPFAHFFMLIFYAHVYHLLCLNAHFSLSYVNSSHLGTRTIVPDLT
jgi:predicted CDP-diglyceride synthetase/phosphatidate cytidylyltransferase